MQYLTRFFGLISRTISTYREHWMFTHHGWEYSYKRTKTKRVRTYTKNGRTVEFVTYFKGDDE